MISINWLVERFWLLFPWFFEPVQNYFNGNFFFILKKKLSSYSTKNVLDLGCGVGTFLDAFKPNSYIGVDINSSFINYARKKHSKLPNVSFICSDVLNYNTSKKFDLVILVSMIHHFPNKQLTSLLKHLYSSINFKKLLIIDGKPTNTIYKPFLQFLDLGADFRNTKELKPFFANNYKIIESGNLHSDKKFYYYPFILVQKKNPKKRS